MAQEQPVPRRNVLVSLCAVVIGAVISLLPIGLGLFSFLDPFRKNRRKPTRYAKATSVTDDGYIKVTSLEALPTGGEPVRFSVIADAFDSWNYLPGQAIGAVYLQRLDGDQVRCFHATCPHAGCAVSYRDQAYHCPCHNSSFQVDGEKLNQPGKENPSPRPLDSLPVDADKLKANGEIWVQFVNFYTGIPEKKVKQ